MSRDDFGALVASVADYFPPSDVMENVWNSHKGLTSSEVLEKIKSSPQYRSHFKLVLPMISRSISDVPSSQVCKDILALIDAYYPSIIRDILESDNSGDKSSGDMLFAVIQQIVDEVKS
jgi:hypothetical protein